MDVVAVLAALLQEERLREVERLFRVAVDAEAARNEADDALVDRGLEVNSGLFSVVCQVGQAAELSHDLLRTQELFAFVREHTLVGVEAGEALSVRRQLVEVVRDELLSH